MATYSYLIQYISDIRGIRQAKGKLRELEVYNTKFGAKVGQVTRVLSKNIQTSTKSVAGGAVQHTRSINRVFETASGQTYKYSRAVTTSGNKVVQTTNKLAKSSAVLGRGLAAQAKGWSRLAVRAIAVIPIWLALRTAFMLVINSIRAIIKAQIDLDEGMARIETVVHGTAEVIARDLQLIKGSILDMAINTRVPIKDLAEVFYFLRTANLETEEAMAAFIPTIDVMIGTGAQAKEVARGLAGMYNTMGQRIGENLTLTETMTKIADTLTFVYATQDVQMGELIQSYTKLAPYLTGLEDSFEDIVVMLGFLNTRMLRAGRTGRLTARSILQIQKNASKLAAIFGITFDQTKPLNLLKTIGLIYNKLQDTTQITFAQGEALRQVFATRGAVAVRLLLASYEDLRAELKKADENLEGFAKRMREIRMDTVAAQAQRLRNIMLVLSIDFFTGALNAEDLTEALKKFADTLEAFRGPMITFGRSIGFITTKTAGLLQILSTLEELGIFIFPSLQQEPTIPTDIFTLFSRLKKDTKELTTSFEDYVKEMEVGSEKIIKKRESQLKVREKMQKVEKIMLNALKMEKENISFQVSKLQSMGALEIEIAEARLKSVENLKDMLTDMEYQEELIKSQHTLVVADLKFRLEQERKISTFREGMLRATGASELQIIQLQLRQLENRKNDIAISKYLSNFLDLRLNKEIAITKTIQKQKDQHTDLLILYHKADTLEKTRIKRLMELLRMPPEQQMYRFRFDEDDRRIMLGNLQYFSTQAKKLIGDALKLMHPEIARLEPLTRNIFLDLPSEGIYRYGENLQAEIQRAIIAGFGAAVQPTDQLTIAREQILELFPQGIEVKPQFGEIHITLPENSLDTMAETVGDELISKLKTDEALQKFLARALRPYM